MSDLRSQESKDQDCLRFSENFVRRNNAGKSTNFLGAANNTYTFKNLVHCSRILRCCDDINVMNDRTSRSPLREMS